MDFLEERSRHYLKVVTEDETFLGRTRNIGVMTKEQADLLGAIGPPAGLQD
jgi:NADH-quinone oxidoreductase subunit D